jgi:hypothetical protein
MYHLICFILPFKLLTIDRLVIVVINQIQKNNSRKKIKVYLLTLVNLIYPISPLFPTLCSTLSQAELISNIA